MPLNRTQLTELLERHGLEPSRALGQNFLADAGMLDKIVRLAEVVPGDHVLEIGPGVGSLTAALADAGAQVTAIEKDRYLEPALREALGDRKVDVRFHDATEVQWATLLSDEHPWTMVSNLPYNVATGLVLDLLEQAPQIQSMLVMVQREVAERLAATPGTKAYGIPSVVRAYWADAKVVGKVPPGVFVPRPRVESALVRIERHPSPAVSAPHQVVFPLVRAAFGQRRKMLRRSLAGMVDDQVFGAANVDPSNRPEQLDIVAWGRLADAVATEQPGGF